MRAVVVLMVAVALAAGCGRIGFDSICDDDKPCVIAAEINDGDTYARGPRLALTVRITGVPPLEARVAEADGAGDCQAQFADDGWQPYVDPATSLDQIVEEVDGVKKLCAWARDGRGKITTIATERAGINLDTIVYQAEHVPIVEAFEVTNLVGGRNHSVGDPMQVAWTISDAEGLADGPVDLDYSTEPAVLDRWLPLAAGIGGPAAGTRQSGNVEIAAPTSAPFIVRIVPRDIAGNRGIAATSDVQNTPGWTVHAGTLDRGIGGSALSARLQHGENVGHQFAIDPISHDVFASDSLHGVVRLDGRTGIVERFLGEGPTNLPDDGPLPPDARIDTVAVLGIGADRRLYVSPRVLTGSTQSRVIYQIDPVTRYCRRYLGGGTGFDATATPTTVFAFAPFGFDEDGTLYFLTSCTPGVWIAGVSTARLMKVTQRADGTAGAISVVAGNCAMGTPPQGVAYDPITSPLGAFVIPNIGTIVSWDRGRVVYVASYLTGTKKIIDGLGYSSSVVAGVTASIAYDRSTSTLYTASNGIVGFTPNLAGADGDVVSRTLVSSDGQGDCTRDGIDATQACVHTAYALQATPEGRLYFLDGPGLNETRTYRIRFVDSTGKVRTSFGTPPFHGVGLDRRVAHAAFAGISYKPATAPNQGAFPAGLYFVDPYALVFGHIDPGTGRAAIDWGNQSGAAIRHATGSATGPDVSLGIAYSAGNLQPLTFDDAGLPWLRYGPDAIVSYFVRLDSSRRVVELQGGTSAWETSPDGAAAFAAGLWPYGAISNLTLDGNRAYLIGGFSVVMSVATIRMLDFGTNQVTRLMGTAPDGVTADRPTPGTVVSASLPFYCHDDAHQCYTAFRSDQNRLYFTEADRLRFITQPAAPTLSTLGTLWTNPSGQSIRNFAFRPDGSQVFYLQDDVLRCHDISSGQPWCDERVLGPPAILGGIQSGPNQLTWRDDVTLLISTYRGQILEYALP